MKNLSLRLVPNFYSGLGNASNGIDNGRNIVKKDCIPPKKLRLNIIYLSFRYTFYNGFKGRLIFKTFFWWPMYHYKSLFLKRNRISQYQIREIIISSYSFSSWNEFMNWKWLISSFDQSCILSNSTFFVHLHSFT